MDDIFGDNEIEAINDEENEDLEDEVNASQYELRSS